MKKRKKPDAPTLASHWSASELPETASDKGAPLYCVATTYTFDARFFEEDLLPRFLGLRHDATEDEASFILEREHALGTVRAFVLVDKSHVKPTQTTLRWDQLPVRVPGGVQHAKVTLLVWEGLIRVLVASANLTKRGYRRNRELVSVLDFYDAPESTPRKLGLDVLRFLEATTEYVAASESARRRLERTLADTKRRLSAWPDIPRDFRAREYPRATFVPCLPPASGRAARSPIDELLRLWGRRIASEITIMTPFVGDPSADHGRLCARLASVRVARDHWPYLIVPGQPSESKKMRRIVNLPRRFFDAWLEAWNVSEDEVATYVVPPVRDDERVHRDLHAKGTTLRGKHQSLLLAGSSNFSPHGMGLGTYNIEANLCFIDGARKKRDGRLLDFRLVFRHEDRCDDAFWPDEPELLEDDPLAEEPALPAAFLWASYSPKSRTIAIAMDPSETPPPIWSVALPAETESKDALLTHRDRISLDQDDRVHVRLEPSTADTPITHLLLRWRDAPKAPERTGVLPLQVSSMEELAPPEDLAGLSLDAILDCLTAGRDPVDWLEIQRRHGNGGTTPPPSNEIDTSAFFLYRVRRFGAATRALGERLLRTPRSEEAMAYRLRQDPIGPLHLLRALESQLEHSDEGEVRSFLEFARAEVALTVSFAGRRLHKERRRGEPDLRPLFRSFLKELRRDRGPTAGSLRSYLGAVDRKAASLLGA